LTSNLKYLSYVIRHKWYVFVECCKLGIPLRGLLHDLSKLHPGEWFPYVEAFYGKFGYSWNGVGCINEKSLHDHAMLSFDKAWLHHQHNNPHHWQYWLLREDSPEKRYLVQGMEGYGGWTLYDNCEKRPIALFTFPVGDYGELAQQAYEDARKAGYSLSVKALEMPSVYRKEMLADWRGAGRAISGKDDTKNWYTNNRLKMVLGPDTRRWIEEQLGV
jgi:hypothetical protein